MNDIDQKRLDETNPFNHVNIEKYNRIYNNERLLFKKALELCTDDNMIYEETYSNGMPAERKFKLPTGQIINVYYQSLNKLNSFQQKNGVKPLSEETKTDERGEKYSVNYMNINMPGIKEGNLTVARIDGYGNISYGAYENNKEIVKGSVPLPKEKYPEDANISSSFPHINDKLINVNNQGDTLIDVIDNLPSKDRENIPSSIIQDFHSLLQPFGREDLVVESDAERMIRYLNEQLQKLHEQNEQLMQKNSQLGDENRKLGDQNTQLGNANSILEQKNAQLTSQNSQQLIVIDAYKKRTAYLENIITKQKEFIDNIKKRFDNIKTSISTVKENLKPTSFMEKIAAKLSKKKNDKISEQSDGIDNIVASFETDYGRFSMNQNSSQETTDEYVNNYVQARSKEASVQTQNRGLDYEQKL